MDAAWHAQLNRAKSVYPHGAEQRSSNALRIQGSQSEVSHSFLHQHGVCLWPPEAVNTSFQASTTIYMNSALDGSVRHNTILWETPLST